MPGHVRTAGNIPSFAANWTALVLECNAAPPVRPPEAGNSGSKTETCASSTQVNAERSLIQEHFLAPEANHAPVCMASRHGAVATCRAQVLSASIVTGAGFPGVKALNVP